MLVESKTNTLYVNINFLEIYFLDLADIVVRYSQNLLLLTLFEDLHSQRMFFQYFFTLALRDSDGRDKRVHAFLFCFIGFEAVNFFIKMSCFGLNLFF